MDNTELKLKHKGSVFVEIPVYIVENHNILWEDGKTYRTFGISCMLGEKIVKRIDDISTDGGLVANMANLFNICKLNPQRFKSALNVLISLDSDVLQSIGLYDQVF